MARDALRLDLQPGNGVFGILLRAAYCCKACVALFVLLTLISAVYDVAKDRYAHFSGLTISSSSSSNSSLSYSLELKFSSSNPGQEQSSAARVGKGGDENESFFASFASFLGSSGKVGRNISSLGQLTGLDGMESASLEGLDPADVALDDNPSLHGADASEIGKKNYNPSSHGTTADELVEESYNPSLHDVATNESGNRISEDHLHENLPMEDLREIPNQGDGNPSPHGTTQDLVMETAKELGKEISKELSQIHENVSMETSTEMPSQGDSDMEEAHQLEMEDDIEVASSDHALSQMHLPALKIRYVGNGTKNASAKFWEKDEFLGFSSPRLLGRRHLNRGDMQNSGFAVLLMLLILTGVLMGVVGVIAFQHAVMMGAISFCVLSTYMGKRGSLKRALKAGVRVGTMRLIWLAILHGTVRGLQCLLFIRTIFKGALDLDQMESMILRLSSMPFSLLAPFNDKDAVNSHMAFRIGSFLVLDYIFDALTYSVYIIACWVSIMEPDKTGIKVLQRSWKLVKSLELQVLAIKVLEAILCGRSCRWVLQKYLGSFVAAFLISAAQTYFIVVWLVLYLSARYKHDGSARFSHSVLEDFLDRHK